MRKDTQAFLQSESGAQAVEYAIIAAIATATIVWAMDAMGPELKAMLAHAAQQVADWGTLF